MPPEQAAAAEGPPLSPASDCYSLGAPADFLNESLDVDVRTALN
jgi:hypothetical protein